MFKKLVLATICLWIACVCASVWLFKAPSFKAQQAYQELMHLSHQDKNNRKSKSSSLTSPIQQTRRQVAKQVLFKSENQRLQWRLKSARSELLWSKNGSGLSELIERFYDVSCSMQEKLTYFNKNAEHQSSFDPLPDLLQPKQLMRHFNATEAVYSYQTGLLAGQEVDVARYVVPGHVWPTSLQRAYLLYEGKAQKLQLSLSKASSFKAEGFQGTFHSWESEW